MSSAFASFREYTESCTSKRMITSVAALIVFCVLIVMIEEIAEENQTSGDFEVKGTSVDTRNGGKPEGKIDETCWQKEAVTVLQSCVKCTEFERKAIKSQHCVSTGYFDRVRCTTSNALSFRPCTPGPSRHSLVVFFVCSLLAALVSGAVALQRKAHLERYAYMRVEQTVN